MKKVLHVLSSNKFSGAENVAIFIIKNTAPVYKCMYCSVEGEIKKTLKESDINYKLIKEFNLKDLKKVINEFDPDIIHAHDVKATILCSILKKHNKLISHIHVNNTNMSKLNLKSILLFISSFRVNRFLWVSSSCYKGYIFKKYLNKKSYILKNILSKKDIYNKCVLDKKKYDFDVVYIGRLSYQKNPERLMKICNDISKTKKNIKIGIVGDGEKLEFVKSYIQKYQLNNISVCGYINNPLKILHDAKVLIMTSRFEGTPMVALESLALGTPIVSTPVDGIKDLIDNSINGYLFEDDDSIVSAILKIINNQDLYENMSKECKKKFDKISDLNEYFKIIKECYEN